MTAMNFYSARSVSSAHDESYMKELQYFDRLHAEKYRDTNQTKQQHCERLSTNLASDSEHKNKLYEILYYNRFLPAGRVQAALGATEREVSPFNCSVSQTIEDSMESIMVALSNAAKILRLGTGIGYNFSHLRPQGAEIRKLKTQSSGPLSFMKIFDVMASTIASSGHRRGAQMGIMNVDHLDIEEFIDAKMEKGAYRQFNLSVGISDKFMDCVKENAEWPLSFNGGITNITSARLLWRKIINNAYESAEPGIIFIDRLNDKNNLWYCEEIEATNPCSEQPLPPYGLCTLGSFNLVAYLYKQDRKFQFNFAQFYSDIYRIVEAYDNIFDDAVYAIPEHEVEAKSKRRMGLGLTGIANAIELMNGEPSYGDFNFCGWLGHIARELCVTAYDASVELAKKRGSFPLYDTDKYLSSNFIKILPVELQNKINRFGIRNSHLISYAPCGTISQTAWNVSSGVEPVFHHQIERDVYMKDGKETITITDFAYREHGFKGKTLEECSIQDHLNVAEICQKYCDSAVSKTVNVASNCSYDEYEQIYRKAYDLGLKGITVYRPTELRGVVIKKAEPEQFELPFPSYNHNPNLSCANGTCDR